MEDLIKAIVNLGFPMAVAGYLHIRIEEKHDKLSTSTRLLPS